MSASDDPRNPYTPGPQATAPGPQHTRHRGPGAGSGLAVAALVLGILALVFFWTVIGGIVLGIAALVMGIMAARRAKAGREGKGTMGIIGAVLGGIAALAAIAMLIAGVSLFNTEEFDNFEDCMSQAENQSDRNQCAEDFSDEITE